MVYNVKNCFLFYRIPKLNMINFGWRFGEAAQKFPAVMQRIKKIYS